MKRKLLAGVLGLFLIIRLFPSASLFWADHISLPLLKLLAISGSRFPFSLLEWILGCACILLPFRLFQKKLLKTLSGMTLVVLLLNTAVWYPLYFLPQPDVSAGNLQIAQLCKDQIDKLNEGVHSFARPRDLPAKFIRFPQWMDRLNITGLCSFLTGEALVSPALDEPSLPFVAVHEAMHLRGIAGEGAANIASWEECMKRGGVYAASARIWALRYGMGILRRDAPSLYEDCLLRMNHETLQAYREAGGAYSPIPHGRFLQRLYAFLGIESVIQDYEILVPWLAAEYTE